MDVRHRLKEMKSLRSRMIIITSIFLPFVLGITGAGLVTLIERAFTNILAKELMANLDQLTSSVEFDKNGHPSIKSPFMDLRFIQPYGGKYWQIWKSDVTLGRSRSLWDTEIQLPRQPKLGAGAKEYKLPGPDGQVLLVMATAVIFDNNSENPRTTRDKAKSSLEETVAKPTVYILATATNYNDIHQLKQNIIRDVLIASVGLMSLLLLTALAIINIGLKPLDSLRKRVAEIVNGETRRIKGNLPTELRPLVSELNNLLAAQEESLRSARNRASGLAHGLKTPLAIMTTESRALRQKGLHRQADEIDLQIKKMQSHVKRELARARARGTGTIKSKKLDVKPALKGLVSVMKRLPGGDHIDWQLELDEQMVSYIDVEDFDEIAGNLLDNARKWAKKKIRISCRQSEHHFRLIVEDDGPGIADNQQSRLLKRGEKLDGSVEGDGVGLAIVRDMVDLYEGSLRLEASQLGGLKIEAFLTIKR